MRTGVLALVFTFSLGACATVPLGPSVMVLPGTGKSFDQFQADDAVCRQWASVQTGTTPQQAAGSSTAKSGVLGTLLGAGLGAAIGAATGHPGVGAAVGRAVDCWRVRRWAPARGRRRPTRFNSDTTTPTSSACTRRETRSRRRRSRPRAGPPSQRLLRLRPRPCHQHRCLAWCLLRLLWADRRGQGHIRPHDPVSWRQLDRNLALRHVSDEAVPRPGSARRHSKRDRAR